MYIDLHVFYIHKNLNKSIYAIIRIWKLRYLLSIKLRREKKELKGARKKIFSRDIYAINKEEMYRNSSNDN